MSMKPVIIPAEEVMKQTQQLHLKKEELAHIKEEASARLNAIILVLKENELLEEKIKEQVKESVGLFFEERKKMLQCYPDIRLGVINKALEFVSSKK